MEWLNLTSDIFTQSELDSLGEGGRVVNNNSQLSEIRFTIQPKYTDSQPVLVMNSD